MCWQFVSCQLMSESHCLGSEENKSKSSLAVILYFDICTKLKCAGVKRCFTVIPWTRGDVNRMKSNYCWTSIFNQICRSNQIQYTFPVIQILPGKYLFSTVIMCQGMSIEFWSNSNRIIKLWLVKSIEHQSKFHFFHAWLDSIHNWYLILFDPGDVNRR